MIPFSCSLPRNAKHNGSPLRRFSIPDKIPAPHKAKIQIAEQINTAANTAPDTPHGIFQVFFRYVTGLLITQETKKAITKGNCAAFPVHAETPFKILIFDNLKNNFPKAYS